MSISAALTPVSVIVLGGGLLYTVLWVVHPNGRHHGRDVEFSIDLFAHIFNYTAFGAGVLLAEQALLNGYVVRPALALTIGIPGFIKLNSMYGVNWSEIGMQSRENDHKTIDESHENRSVETDGGVETVVIEDEFVRGHATPREDATSFVHVAFDPDYHPTGGYWFPSRCDPDPEQTGCVPTESRIPRGEIVQYPCDKKPVRRIGPTELPQGVKNRVLNDDAIVTDDG